MKNKILNNKGFTLIEIIVVLVIISILMTIAMPSIFGYTQKGQETAAISECRSVVTAAIQELSDKYVKTGNREFDSDVINKSLALSNVEGYVQNQRIGSEELIEYLEYVHPSGIVAIYENGKYRIAGDGETAVTPTPPTPSEPENPTPPPTSSEPETSAPPVTEVQILEVVSTKGGYEYVFGKLITDQDHEGELFLVSTGVTGYGGNQYDRAKFAGNDAVQLSSEGIDLTGDNIVDGWLDIWDISQPANKSGIFEFTSSSINPPSNSMSTSIQIR